MKKIVMVIFFLSAMAQHAVAQKSCEAKLEQLVKEAEIIVVAEVLRVSAPPGVWSDFVMMSQYVDYTGSEVLKGKLSRNGFSAGHFVVEGGELSDLAEPRLSPAIFSKGKKLLLFIKTVKKGDYRYGELYPYPAPLKFGPSESLCVLKGDQTIVDKVKAALKDGVAYERYMGQVKPACW